MRAGRRPEAWEPRDAAPTARVPPGGAGGNQEQGRPEARALRDWSLHQVPGPRKGCLSLQICESLATFLCWLLELPSLAPTLWRAAFEALCISGGSTAPTKAAPNPGTPITGCRSEVTELTLAQARPEAPCRTWGLSGDSLRGLSLGDSSRTRKGPRFSLLLRFFRTTVLGLTPR